MDRLGVQSVGQDDTEQERDGRVGRDIGAQRLRAVRLQLKDDVGLAGLRAHVARRVPGARLHARQHTGRTMPAQMNVPAHLQRAAEFLVHVEEDANVVGGTQPLWQQRV